MAVDQLPGRMREFVAYLDGVLARLDQGAGWCAVFWQRDPDGMQACLDGREVPPWDVVEALLQDLAATYGPEVAHAEAERARPLHAAAQAAHDARPGGRDALGDRFDVMLREQRYAAERQAELGRRLATANTQEEADAIRLDLAWARDDHERAVRRCAELQSRMAELDHRAMNDQARAIRRGRVAEGGTFGGGEGGGGRGLGGGHGDGFATGGENAAGGRSSGSYGNGGPGGGDGQVADGSGGAGWEPGRYEGAAAGGGGLEATPHVRGGHESGDHYRADGRSVEFPDMPRQRDATSARDAEAPHAGQTAQWSTPTGAALSGQAPHPSATAWTDAHGHPPQRPGAEAAGLAEGGRPGHAPRPTTPAWVDDPAHAPRRPGPGEAAHQGRAPQPPAPAWADTPGYAPQRPGPGAAAPLGRAPQSATPADAATPGRATHYPGHAAAARSGHAPHPSAAADTTHPGPLPQQHRESGTSHTPYPRAPAPVTRPDIEPPQQPSPTAPAPEAKRKRRRGGARFAGAAEDGGAPVVVPPAAVPDLPTAPVAKGRTPRGARFAGAAQAPEASPRPGAEPSDVAARRETAETVAALARLRSEGRTGEAHALLAEVAHWPADRFPLLAAELQHAGLGADWASLLWEAASLPADRLVAAADALVAAGRSTDGEQVLRQGVARPAGEIGAAVLALVAEGRRREVTALLDAYVRVRTPEEAARSAEPGPATLVPLLLAAARGVSDERHWDLVHALRVAGFSA
ncbi:hypothetical protein [Streptomyces sp. NPDC005303]|uniref:hypothetical protein n=1 Tax=Streptomyces sp. NPDC005303 TaxID=3155713 RepID=UPI0033B47D45